jgi:hypothetical protein
VTDTTAGKNVGKYFSALATTGADARNYQTSFINANLTITPYVLGSSVGGPAVSATANNRVYNTTTGATGSLAMTGLFPGDVVAANFSSASFASPNANNGITVTFNGVTLSGAAAANYVLGTAPVTAAANITPAPVTISGLLAQNKVYTSTTADAVTGTPVVIGLLGSDTATATGTVNGQFASPNVANGISVAANLSGLTLSNSNYYIAGVTTPLTANITPAPVTISGLLAQNKIFDGTTMAVITGNPVIAGLLGLDVSTLSGSVIAGIFASANPGDKILVTAILNALILGNPNYYIAGVTFPLVADITAPPQTINNMAIVQQQVVQDFVPDRPSYLINKGELIYVRDKDSLPDYLQAIEVPSSGSFKFPVPDSIIQDLINLSGENVPSAKQAGSYKLLLLPQGSRLVVTLPDGAALPAGIKYDVGTKSFTVPKLGNVTLPLSVKVTLMRGNKVLSQKIMVVTK